MTREFVQRQHERRDHTAFLQRKVDAARISVHDRQGRSNEAVETDFVARRTRIADQA